MRLRLMIALFLPFGSVFAQSGQSRDAAIALAFEGGKSRLAVLQRTALTAELDLVIAMDVDGAPAIGPGPVWWGEERRIGLFFQERTSAGRVYPLGEKAGFAGECEARVERATATDTVIACHGQKPGRYAHQKWTYDLGRKKATGQFGYEPVAMYRVFAEAGGAVFVGGDGERMVTVEYASRGAPAWRVLTEAEALPWVKRLCRSLAAADCMEVHRVRWSAGHNPKPPQELAALPATTWDQFAATRPQRVANGYLRGNTVLQDSAGPWQREGSRIWFGKAFYDGEGYTGVGGFGYFDAKGSKPRIFQPPEIVNWSVQAMDVAQDAVWMALVGNGEYGGSSGGLIRYDRQSEKVEQIQLPDIGVSLARVAGNTLVATDFGMAVVSNADASRYFVDRAADGSLRIVRATR